MMNWLWTWGGTCFGYRDGDDLWTYDGEHVGRFKGDEIYGRDGRYLGEIMSENRLITNRAKSNWPGYTFTPYARRGGYAAYANYAGYAMYAGHQDFPDPGDF
jgi:hypothetical protein